MSTSRNMVAALGYDLDGGVQCHCYLLAMTDADADAI